jgi:glycosyltransferase involved in cell wall biosynthesis
MGNSITISVIVPVYNVEKYLRRCVNSILNQTYNNLEVILVDDGSPDGCPQMCDEYAQRDSRVTVIHKKNGGLSSARNAALESPLNGDFVTFIDSDDWIEPDTYEYCIKTLKKNAADTIQFNYMTTKKYVTGVKQKKEHIELYKDIEILKYYLKSSFQTGSYSVCRCLFPIKAIGEIRFREGKINEDIDFKYKVLRNTEKMVVTNQVKYMYFQHGETTSSGGLRKRDYDLYDSAEELYKLVMEDKNAKLEELAFYKKARTPFSLLSKISYFGISDKTITKKETIHRLTNELRMNVKLLLKSPMSLSRKILAICFCIDFRLANMLVKVVKTIKAPI